MLFLDRSGTFRSICPDMVAKRLRRKFPVCLKNSKENYIMRLTKRYLSSLFFFAEGDSTSPLSTNLQAKDIPVQDGTHYPSRSQVMGDQPSTRTPTESISTTVSLRSSSPLINSRSPPYDAVGGTGPEKNCLCKFLIGSILSVLICKFSPSGTTIMNVVGLFFMFSLLLISQGYISSNGRRFALSLPLRRSLFSRTTAVSRLGPICPMAWQRNIPTGCWRPSSRY